MKKTKDLIRWLTPFGMIESHRRSFRLHRLGLEVNASIEEAVNICRYELWPKQIRSKHLPYAIVDIGANNGDFIAAASALASWENTYVFEPQNECQVKLYEVLESIPNSNLYQAAVGEKEGEIELLCTANSKLASILPPDQRIVDDYAQGDFDVEQRVTVPIMRLDDVIPVDIEIGLLKIDVQGYELPVLKGAAKTLCRTHALLVEVNYVSHYETGAMFDEVYQALRLHGFRMFGVSEPYAGKEGPLWADAMFVKDLNK